MNYEGSYSDYVDIYRTQPALKDKMTKSKRQNCYNRAYLGFGLENFKCKVYTFL